MTRWGVAGRALLTGLLALCAFCSATEPVRMGVWAGSSCAVGRDSLALFLLGNRSASFADFAQREHTGWTSDEAACGEIAQARRSVALWLQERSTSDAVAVVARLHGGAAFAPASVVAPAPRNTSLSCHSRGWVPAVRVGNATAGIAAVERGAVAATQALRLVSNYELSGSFSDSASKDLVRRVLSRTFAKGALAVLLIIAVVGHAAWGVETLWGGAARSGRAESMLQAFVSSGSARLGRRAAGEEESAARVEGEGSRARRERGGEGEGEGEEEEEEEEDARLASVSPLPASTDPHAVAFSPSYGKGIVFAMLWAVLLLCGHDQLPLSSEWSMFLVSGVTVMSIFLVAFVTSLITVSMQETVGHGVEYAGEASVAAGNLPAIAMASPLELAGLHGAGARTVAGLTHLDATGAFALEAAGGPSDLVVAASQARVGVWCFVREGAGVAAKEACAAVCAQAESGLGAAAAALSDLSSTSPAHPPSGAPPVSWWHFPDGVRTTSALALGAKERAGVQFVDRVASSAERFVANQFNFEFAANGLLAAGVVGVVAVALFACTQVLRARAWRRRARREAERDGAGRAGGATTSEGDIAPKLRAEASTSASARSEESSVGAIRVQWTEEGSESADEETGERLSARAGGEEEGETRERERADGPGASRRRGLQKGGGKRRSEALSAERMRRSMAVQSALVGAVHARRPVADNVLSLLVQQRQILSLLLRREGERGGGEEGGRDD